MPTPEDNPLNRKPWPMKWIIIGILACIIPYTWLTIAYRKPNPAHEPYQDNKDRAQVLRLLDSGFHRIELPMNVLVVPPGPTTESATSEAIPGGFPPLLHDVLIERPPVPSEYLRVTAPVTALASAPYTFDFVCTQPDHDELPAQTQLYHRQQELVIIVGFETTPGELQSRRLEFTALITIPANTLEPGTYRATLVGARESRRWTFEVL